MCGRLLIVSQDKEKPMAVRTANILAARGTYYFMLMRIIMLTYQQPLLMLSERYEYFEMVVSKMRG